MEDYTREQKLDRFVDQNIICSVNALVSYFEDTRDGFVDELRDVMSRVDEDGGIVEALEFWHVSDWLYRKLSEKGELLTDEILDFNIWGRTCVVSSFTGSSQAISMDTVIAEIYDAL